MINPIALAERFIAGKNTYDVDPETWREAFHYIDRNLHSISFNRPAVHLIWTESGGHIRNKIRDDSLILRVLTAALPKYDGPGLVLFRGECRFLYSQSKIGFSWTPKLDVATCFARGLNSIESGGVLLKAYAPPEAILAAPNEHSTKQMEEFEYTCDPTSIEGIEVLQQFPRSP
jgi:hypothetical protein